MKDYKKLKVVLVVFLLVLIFPALYFYNQSQLEIFTYKDFSFEYNSRKMDIEFEEPETYSVGPFINSPVREMTTGKLSLKRKEYEIAFRLQDKRIPNSNTTTWFGVPENYIKENNNVIEKIELNSRENQKDYVICSDYDLDFEYEQLCTVYTLADDNLYYRIEISILGLDYTEVNIYFNDGYNFKNIISIHYFEFLAIYRNYFYR